MTEVSSSDILASSVLLYKCNWRQVARGPVGQIEVSYVRSLVLMFLNTTYGIIKLNTILHNPGDYNIL